MTPICCPLTSIYTLSHVPSLKQININRNQFEIASYSELHNTIMQWLALSHLRHESLLCPEHSHFMFYLIVSHLMAFSVKKSTFIIPHCLCESRSLLFTNGPKHNLVKEEIHNVEQGEKVNAIYKVWSSPWCGMFSGGAVMCLSISKNYKYSVLLWILHAYLLVYIKSPTYLVMIKISFHIRFRFVDGNGVIVTALVIVMRKHSILLCLSTEQEHGILGHMLQRTSFINKAKYNSEPETMR